MTIDIVSSIEKHTYLYGFEYHVQAYVFIVSLNMAIRGNTFGSDDRLSLQAATGE